MASASVKTKVLWAALGVLGIAAAMAVISTSFNGMSPASGRMLGSSITTAIYALLALLGALVIANRPRLGWWAVGLLAASYVAWMGVIWFADLNSGQTKAYRIAALFTIAGGTALHLGVLFWPRFRAGHWQIIRLLVCGSSLVTAMILVYAFVLNTDPVGSMAPLAFGGILLLLSLFGTVMIHIASAIEKSSAEDEHEVDIGERLPVEVRCPRCHTHSSIRSNTKGACESCGLNIRVTIQEPRCACGYLLYNLTAELCPECGIAIEEQSRWRSEMKT